MSFGRRTLPLLALFLLPLLLPLLAAACRGGDAPGEIPRGRPIIVVSIDTLRSDHLPAYGYPGVETPALDRFREDAILFERAYSPVPLTLPAHASLFTGLLPAAHGVHDNAGYRLADGAGATVAERLRELGYRTGGAISSYVMRADTGIGRGFETWDDRLPEASRATMADLQRGGGATLAAARPWLAQAAGSGRPFFFFFHIYEPHVPWDPPEPFAGRYGRTYDGEIAAADRIVGDLFAALDELNVYERATIIVLSDHGEGLGDHGEEEHGVLLYRESLQVPLLVKLPGAAYAGESVAHPVGLTDLAPTLLTLASPGAPADAPPATDLPGRSLLSFLSGGAKDEPPRDDRPLFAETFHARLRYGWSGLTSVIRGRYHYIQGPDRELYDLVADPEERHNLVRDERRVYAELRDLLATGYPPRLEQPFEESSEARAALAALGYLGSNAQIGEGPLPDPKERLGGLATLREGIQAEAAGDHQRAVELLGRATEEIPEAIDAWQFLGVALEGTGDREGAYAAYRKAFEVSDGAGHLARPLARLALELQRLDDALAFLRRAREAEPDDPALAALEARTLLLAGRPDAALTTARAAAERFPQSADVHYMLGAILMGSGTVAAAESALGRTLEIDPDHPGALNDLAVLLMSQGRRDDARRLLEHLVRIQPNNRAARENLARLGR